jgi:hypothetical protein
MLVNWPLLKNPLNWVTVILMVMIGAYALDQAYKFFQQQTTAAQTGS